MIHIFIYQEVLFKSGNRIIYNENYCKQRDNYKNGINNFNWDAFAKYGVKLWRPDSNSWSEVSVRGAVYDIKSNEEEAPILIQMPFDRQINEFTIESNDNTTRLNELIDGSIIDIGGIRLLFQKPCSIVNKCKVI